LLQVTDPLARLQRLHAQRSPLYREIADLVVDGNSLDAKLIVRLLMKELQAYQKVND
jgi:shikimate kinase